MKLRRKHLTNSYQTEEGLIRRRQVCEQNIFFLFLSTLGNYLYSIYYSKKIGKVNSGKVTTFSEYSIVSENRVTAIKLPKKI